MWHPPSDHVRSEEENQMKLAITRSLEHQSVSCQFCNTQTNGIDELQLHRMKCQGIFGSASVEEHVEADEDTLVFHLQNSQPDVFTGFGNPEVYSPAIKRKSGSCRMPRTSQTNSPQS